MIRTRLWLGALLVAAALAGPAAGPVAGGAVVTAARLGVHGETTRFVAEFSHKQPFQLFTLSDPDRIVIDLPAVDWRAAQGAGAPGRGLIAAFRYGQFQPGSGRLVLDLSGPARVARAEWLSPRDGHAWRLLFDLDPVARETFLKTAGWPKPRAVASAVPAPAPKPDATPVEAPPAVVAAPSESVSVASLADAISGSAKKIVQAPEDDPSGLPVIVIDPGHGGIDPGASAENGTLEKDVVLAVAQELSAALQDTRRYDVRLTRGDDTFLKLTERVDFARHTKADMFISLHADALSDNPKVGGLSVYTLSETASDKEAEALARKENRADVIAGVDLTSESDDVTMILIDLAQRETMNQSVQLAHGISNALKSQTRLVKNTIRHAGFRVLKAPDMCSVLIELGYLSNAKDLDRMTSEKWRGVFAAAVVEAVDSHFASYGEQRSAFRQ